MAFCSMPALWSSCILMAVLLCSSLQQSDQPQRWEMFLERLTVVLEESRFMACHFVCRAGQQCVSESLLAALNRRMAITYTYTVVREVAPAVTLDSRGYPVVETLHQDTAFLLMGLEEDACEVVRARTSNTYNLVVVFSSRPKQDFIDEMGVGFEGCWKHQLLKVIAVHQEDADLAIYSYNPFYSGNCYDTRPRLISYWTPGFNFTLNSFDVYGPLRNLNKCKIRIATFSARPWVVPVHDNKTSRLIVKGAYGPLIYELERRLNFTVDARIASDNGTSGSPVDYPRFGGMLGDVYHNRTELALMLISDDIALHPHFSRPTTAQMACITWCLPMGRNPIPLWRPLVDEFETPVWVGLLLAYVLAAVVLRLLIRGTRLWNTAFTALNALVGSVQPEPRSAPARAFLFSWSFFGLVMGTLYSGALQSISTTDTTSTVFRSLRELADSDLPIYMSDLHFVNFSRSQSASQAEVRIRSRSHVFAMSDLAVPYLRLIFKRDIGVLLDANSCRFYATNYASQDGGHRKPAFHTLRGYCMATTGSSNMIFKKGSHLTEPLDTLMSRVDQSGLTNHWLTPKSIRDDGEHDPVMRFQQLKPFLRLLGVGLAAATATILAELLCFHCFYCRRATAERRM